MSTQEELHCRQVNLYSDRVSVCAHPSLILPNQVCKHDWVQRISAVHVVGHTPAPRPWGGKARVLNGISVRYVFELGMHEIRSSVQGWFNKAAGKLFLLTRATVCTHMTNHTGTSEPYSSYPLIRVCLFICPNPTRNPNPSLNLTLDCDSVSVLVSAPDPPCIRKKK